MKAIHKAIPEPVRINTSRLLRPNASCRKKYSDIMRVITATKKGNISFLMPIKSVEYSFLPIASNTILLFKHTNMLKPTGEKDCNENKRHDLSISFF